jgi:hypothetical protein
MRQRGDHHRTVLSKERPMKYHAFARLAAVAGGAVLAVSATAQTPPPVERPDSPPGTVMSDVAPLPAEERSSTGAVVLQRTRSGAVDRSAKRALSGKDMEADLAAREAATANDLKRMGAGALQKP